MSLFSSNNITQFFILPDPLLTEAEVMTSANAPLAAPTKPALISPSITPASTNLGNNSAFAMGSPTLSTEYDLRAQTSGTLGEATWAWKDKTKSDDNYYGQHDMRYRHDFSDPFDSGAASFQMNSMAAVYNPKLKKEFLYTYKNLSSTNYPTGSIRTRYRDAGVSNYEQSWTTASNWNIRSSSKQLSQHKLPYHGIDVCVMPDGTFRMAIISNNDITIFSSVDGLEWTAICDRVTSRFLGRKAAGLDEIRLVSSGYYLRIVCVEYVTANTAKEVKDTSSEKRERAVGREDVSVSSTEYGSRSDLEFIDSWYLLGLVSIDGGSSWDLTNQFDIVPGTVDFDGPKWSFDVSPADDSGTFILMVKPDVDLWFDKTESSDPNSFLEEYDSYVSLSQNGIMAYTGYMATGSGSFQGQENLNIHHHGSWGSEKPFMCKTDAHLVIYYSHLCQRNNYLNVENTSDAIEYNMERIPLGSNLQEVNWTALGSVDSSDTEFGITGFNCAIRYLPAVGKLFWAGGSLSFFHKAYDRSTGINSNLGLVFYYKMGGWSIAPVRSFNAGNYPDSFLMGKKSLDELNPWQPKGAIFAPYWDVTIGSPAENNTQTNSSLNTPFKRSIRYCTQNLTTESLKLANIAYNVETYAAYTFQDPGVGAYPFRNGADWNNNTAWSPSAGLSQYDYSANSAILPGGAYRNQATPDINWCFVPDNAGTVSPYNSAHWWSTDPPPDVSIPATNGHGSCIVWTSKIHRENTAPSVQNTTLVAGISLNSFMLDSMSIWEPPVTTPPNFKSAMVRCSVRLRKSYAIIWDERQNIALATISPSTDFFANSFVEFRWGWYPLSVQGVWSATKANTNIRTACVLMARQKGTETWHSTPMVYPKSSTTTADSDYVAPSFVNSTTANPWHQSVSFGLFPHTPTVSSGGATVIEFQNFGVHRSNDLTSSALMCQLHSDFSGIATSPWKYVERKDVPRGKLMTGEPVLMNDKIEIVWGGTGGMDGDSYSASNAFSYSSKNAVAFASPRTMFRSEASPSSVVLDFKAPNDKVFSHRCVALFNTNIRRGTVSYRSTVATAITTSKDFDATIITGRVSSVTEGVWVVDYFGAGYAGTKNENIVRGGSLSSSDKRSFYLEITTTADTYYYSTNTVFKVDNHIGSNSFTFEKPDISKIAQSSMVGTSVAIFADRSVVEFDSIVHLPIFRLASNTPYTYEGHVRIGTIVGGQKFDFNVPLDWAYSDTETPNQTEFTTRSGVYWCYNEGPPNRELSLSIVGDVSEEERLKLRDSLRSLSNYSQRPIVFFNGFTQERTDNLILSRYMGSTSMANEGWYYDPNNLQWKPIGNMSIKLQEVV